MWFFGFSVMWKHFICLLVISFITSLHCLSLFTRFGQFRCIHTSDLKTELHLFLFFLSKKILNNLFRIFFYHFVKIFKVHCPPKVMVQSALLFSAFVHNSSINELKNMKLSKHICYEMISWILYCCDFGNSL